MLLLESASIGARAIFLRSSPWTWHEHVNEGNNEAILFSIQDTPVFETLGLYREEAYTEHNGHQPVTRV